MASQKEEVELLRAYLKKLQKWYDRSFELVPADLPPEPDEPPTTDPEEEQIARIADDYGFDGSLFRREIRDRYPLSAESINRLKEKIEAIPKIIAAIEKPVDKSAVPKDAELLSVAQVATMLGWGESVVRQRDKEGLLPMPYRFGGTIQWSRKELESWISAGCPNRQQWEQQKQRKVV
jgi:predicted DNA-binding transcriptional regulator AlpA